MGLWVGMGGGGVEFCLGIEGGGVEFCLGREGGGVGLWVGIGGGEVGGDFDFKGAGKVEFTPESEV